MLDVQAVVIDGDLPRRADRASWSSGCASCWPRQRPEAREPPALRIGTVGRSAAATGAAILPFHLNYSPSQQMLFGQHKRGRTRETAQHGGRDFDGILGAAPEGRVPTLEMRNVSKTFPA